MPTHLVGHAAKDRTEVTLDRNTSSQSNQHEFQRPKARVSDQIAIDRLSVGCRPRTLFMVLSELGIWLALLCMLVQFITAHRGYSVLPDVPQAGQQRARSASFARSTVRTLVK